MPLSPASIEPVARAIGGASRKRKLSGPFERPLEMSFSLFLHQRPLLPFKRYG